MPRSLDTPHSPNVPTYEFRCPNGHDFQRFYKTISAGTAAVDIACPECGAVAGRRLSAGAGLLFKGSGFYLTDYGKNAHRASGATPPATGGEPSASKGDAPNADAPKADVPKGDAPKADAPKTDAPKSPAPKTESRQQGAAKPKSE